MADVVARLDQYGKQRHGRLRSHRIVFREPILASFRVGGRVDRWLYISRILSVFIQSVGDGSHEREIINIGKHRSISVFNRYLIHYLDTKFEVESFDLKLYRHEEIRKKTSRKLLHRRRRLPLKVKAGE